MFRIKFEPVKVNYDLSIRRYNREKYSIFHQVNFSETSYLNFFKKL